ncbi:RNA polymerase sigma factor SigJ [Micromonospora sp. NPDC049559]|uniref:RNA polymerase sigma factor SigJ n=1 Tax=Micromonospora sp. NPDC049559 TaxID=3155923 RepID=UPI0034471916
MPQRPFARRPAGKVSRITPATASALLCQGWPAAGRYQRKQLRLGYWLRWIRKPEEVAICMGDGHGPRRSERDDPLGAEWENHRPAVFGAAYRLLGSVTDAEDVTQETWLRAARADLREIVDLRAWLVTVAARLSYDLLKSARFRRETYVGPWLPEPLLTGPDASQPVLVDESVTSAMLLVMEELSPPERVAFVLHDVFGLEFGRIAEVLDVSVPSARQLASRARRRVAGAKRSTPSASKAERERVLTIFRAAYEAGDLAGLVRLLHPGAVYVTDGGGEVSAARKFIHGGARIAEVMLRVGRQWRLDRVGFVEVGGELALVFHREGRVYSVDTVQITDGLITAYRRVVNPDKLVRVRAVTPGGVTSSPW